MRTTLKKGTRGATNGHAELDGGPPEVSASSSPRALYRMPRRNPLRLIGKVFLWLVVVVLVAAGGLAGGVELYFNYTVSEVRASSREVKEAQKILAEPVPGQPAVAIVIGYDKRFGPESAIGSRSDTVMLVRADPGKKVLSLLSFPRDLIVDIPGCRDHPPFRGRINEAYTYCGPRGTLATVKDLTGIPVNYMITVNFRAFTRIVDKLGGVYMDVDQRYFNDNAGLGPGQTYDKINLQPGYQRLSGRRALDFVRYRHTDSDLYRVVRQQEFVKAFKQQISSTWTLLQLPGIVNAITDNVEVAKGGRQEIEPGEVRGYAKLLYELPAGNFQQVQMEGLTGYNELAVPEEELQTAIDRFMSPDIDAPEKAIAVATGSKPKTPAGPPPSEVTVEVQNGNGIVGAAADATYLLGLRGYQAINGSNADRFDYFRTQILWNPDVPDAQIAAEKLGDAFVEAEVEEASPADGLTTTLRVILGETFTGELGAAPRDETPEREPPAVVADPDSVTPLLEPLRRRAGFPLLVPTMREESSALSDVEGVRLYDLEGEKALRLTYRMGSGDYWGIQQAAWTEAPVLDGPTLTRTIRGREYKLYFSGSKLHMVAFEENDSAYWVVNTLLNRMSNETMLRIARGLQPLSKG
ncbi:MAG TPA: LCP family protein [Gaiellaceae bacterium]|nr:LCP family protein [Gaiellaceae bacterium]